MMDVTEENKLKPDGQAKKFRKYFFEKYVILPDMKPENLKIQEPPPSYGKSYTMTIREIMPEELNKQ